ncbi:MAG: oxidoreductase, partial [Niveispirillum sp.]|nr:oxidoreductase [Niveispirillum sp.]
MILSSLAPAALAVVAAAALLRPGRRPKPIPALAEITALLAFALTIGGTVQFALDGPVSEGPLRLSMIGAVMAPLVGFIGWIVLRYSRTYLDGAEREGRFHGLMLLVLALVLLVVQAGSLWLLAGCMIAIGLVLRQLLLFYT